MRLHDQTGQRKYLTSAERAQFLHAAQAARREVRTFCATLAYTGCRIFEALALTADRVDLDDGVLIFESLKKTPPAWLWHQGGHLERASQYGAEMARPRPTRHHRHLYGCDRPRGKAARRKDGAVTRPACCLRDFRYFPSSFSCESTPWESGLVVLKLVHVWSTAANGTSAPVAPSLTQADIDDEEFSSNDPDIPEYLLDRKKAKQHERGLAAAAERSHQERQVAAEREKQDEDDAERERQAWLNSDYYRTAVQELSDDIHDAREAIGFATARAAQEQREARAALESTQREALLVSGKRAYFTRDGRHLYGEDQREITDQATLAEARRQLEHRPDAPAYEDYVARKLAAQLANEKAERLGAICSPAGSTRSEGAGRQSQPRRPCRGPQGSPRCH